MITFRSLAAALSLMDPQLNDLRIVAVDGRACSGKTSFARELHRELPGSAVVGLDGLIEGWDGMFGYHERLWRQVIEPLAAGRAACFTPYDWDRMDWAEEERTIDPTSVLIIEGVTAADARMAPVAISIWIEAPAEDCLRRGVARDGDDVLAHGREWQRREVEYFSTHGNRASADLEVDGVRTDPRTSDEVHPLRCSLRLRQLLAVDGEG